MKISIKNNIHIFKNLVGILLIIFVAFLLTQCAPQTKLTILSGSENVTLEPLLQTFAKEKNIDIVMNYKGSVDIMMDLEQDNIPYDAVWPANNLWIAIGDKNHLVKHTNSIMTSPVVFGIKKSLAQRLGFVGRKVSVKDILQAIMDKKLTFMMTSASQSNSGASAYFGFLYALLGNPETITSSDLHQPKLKEQIRKLLSGINRSSGSSDWLKDLFLSGDYDAMVNYESLIIETNQELLKRNREPLYVVYPYDGIVIADSPLGYINHGDRQKEQLFNELQTYLLSEKVQHQILQLGRRTGYGGVLDKVDATVFNPEWGIETKKVLSPIKLPSIGVIQEALNLYQTEFKKPSYTVFCLDFSESMQGKGEDQLKAAMSLILDQNQAKKYLLQSTSEDVVTIIAFNNDIINTWQVHGNNQNDYHDLLQKITELSPDGGTDIYSPVMNALEELKKVNIANYIPAIVLMTDGQSNTGKNFKDLESSWQNLKLDIPVFAITFGDASERQLDKITILTRGRVFDGKKDLVGAFKKARGYN